MRNAGRRLSVVFAMLLIAGSAGWAAGGVKASFDPRQVQWEAQEDHEGAVLTVSLPGGEVVRQEFGARETPVFELAAGARDGAYTYELRLVPRIDPSLRKALAEARRSGDAAALARLRAEVPESPVMSGGFLVEAGAIVVPKAPAGSPRNVTAADQVILDDLIVKGNECVGTDCVNNETFGSDTLRIKTLTPRIKLDDTSSSVGFPNNDWQITANDSDSGGANKFSIDDITGAKVPFTLTAGAPTNSLFVTGTGRIGFRTATPALDLHVNSGDAPGLRLEQNGTGGMTAQTWDIVGDEVNFFVRDVTGGDRQPFRIRPGAPTSSLDIGSTGRVGLGTASPSAQLHVLSTTGVSLPVLIQESSGTVSLRTMLQLENNGASRLQFTDDSTAATWSLQNTTGNLNMLKSGTGVTAFILQGSGALTIGGALTQNSNRDAKTGIVEVDPDTILARVAGLPISEWTYKADDSKARHLGPMAQDFAAAFHLGEDDLHIAPADMAGVSLAAIQALYRQVSELDARNRQLTERLSALEAELAAVESHTP